MASRSGLVAVVVLAVLLPPVLGGWSKGCAPVLGNTSLRLSTPSFAIDFATWNGAITGIYDADGRTWSTGSNGGCLWGISFSDDSYVGGCSYGAEWDDRLTAKCANASAVTLTYTSATGPVATVTFLVTSDARGVAYALDLLTPIPFPETGARLLFLAELMFPVRTNETLAGLIPHLPGRWLGDAFFRSGATAWIDYPSWNGFADAVWLEKSTGRTVAVFGRTAQLTAAPTTTTYLNSMPASQQVMLTRVSPLRPYGTRVGLAGTILFDASPAAALAACLSANQIKVPQPTATQTQRVKRLFIKLDAGQADVAFADYPARVFPLLPPKSIIHLVQYWTPVFDRNYPNFVSAARPGLSAMCSKAVAAGFEIIPYINPTWWNPVDNFTKSTPPLAKVAARDAAFEFIGECYPPNCGYVVSPQSPGVQATLTALIRSVRSAMSTTAVFEDQIGARFPPLDMSSGALWLAAATQNAVLSTYAAGWVAHVQNVTASGMAHMTEQGFDRLAGVGCTGFHGSIIGRPLDDTWWAPFPWASAVLRRGVSLYQHDLATESLTVSLPTLAWNVAMGYHLTVDFSWVANCPSCDTSLSTLTWVGIATAWQTVVLGDLAWAALVSFTCADAGSPTGSGNSGSVAARLGVPVRGSWGCVTRSSFEQQYDAWVNWRTVAVTTTLDQTLTVTLPSNGIVVAAGPSSNRRLIAAAVTAFPGATLAPSAAAGGAHHFVYLRDVTPLSGTWTKCARVARVHNVAGGAMTLHVAWLTAWPCGGSASATSWTVRRAAYSSMGGTPVVTKTIVTSKGSLTVQVAAPPAPSSTSGANRVSIVEVAIEAS